LDAGATKSSVKLRKEAITAFSAARCCKESGVSGKDKFIIQLRT